MSDNNIANNVQNDEEDDNESGGQNEKDKMLGADKERRSSTPGIQPTPMINANLYSKYISFW